MCAWKSQRNRHKKWPKQAAFYTKKQSFCEKLRQKLSFGYLVGKKFFLDLFIFIFIFGCAASFTWEINVLLSEGQRESSE